MNTKVSPEVAKKAGNQTQEEGKIGKEHQEEEQPAGSTRELEVDARPEVGRSGVMVAQEEEASEDRHQQRHERSRLQVVEEGSHVGPEAQVEEQTQSQQEHQEEGLHLGALSNQEGAQSGHCLLPGHDEGFPEVGPLGEATVEEAQLGFDIGILQ